MSWLFKREPDAGDAADPYISMNINGTSADSSRDYIANAFNEHWRDGEWCLVTCAVKLRVALSSLSLNLFPHGQTPQPGRKTRFIRPYVYTTNSPNKVIPYIDDYTARSVTASPNVPGFLPGDIVKNAGVSVGGQSQFVKLAGADNDWAYA